MLANWSLRLIGLAFGVVFITLGLFRLGWLPVSWALIVVAFACVLAGGALVIGIASFFTQAGKAEQAKRLALISIILSAIFLIPPLLNLRLALVSPPIHDIASTPFVRQDFKVLANERKPSDNTLVVPDEVPQMQAEAYPDIAPHTIKGKSYDVVFAHAEALARDRGWRVAYTNMSEGRIEAVETSFLFGFKDDVLVQLFPVRKGVEVTMRSASRVGRSDLGQNARRIRNYLADLDEATKE